jgi:hypothetical protein
LPNELCFSQKHRARIQRRARDRVREQLDNLGKRLDRIERRLDLAETPAAG